MSTQQQSLAQFGGTTTEFEQQWGVTREKLEERAKASVPRVKKSCERICEECGARVTQTNTMGEVGHKWGERPSETRCSQSQRGMRQDGGDQ